MLGSHLDRDGGARYKCRATTTTLDDTNTQTNTQTPCLHIMSVSASQWKTPTDIMRLRRSKQKSSLSARRRWPKEEDKDSHSTSSQPLHKRRNPFRCDSPSKRLCAHLDNKENSPVPASASDDEDIVCSDSESEHSQHKLVLALSSVDQVTTSESLVMIIARLHVHCMLLKMSKSRKKETLNKKCFY